VSAHNLHRLKLTAEAGRHTTTIELDGQPLMCTRVEITAAADRPYAEARITLPVSLELDGVVNAHMVRPVAVRPTVEEPPE